MTRGLVLGKFLPYHSGHAHLIRTARAQVYELVVLVCSIASEPIDGALRYGWVKESHPDCRVVHVAEELPQTPADDPDFWPIWRDVVLRYAGTVDRVFTSERYGDALADWTGATHTCVDLDRSTFPVSGTAIRQDPMANWRFIPPVVRPYYVRRIAILGAESTGKTTLAARLAGEFGTAWVPEFGRAYCEGRDVLALVPDDFDAIGRGQLAAEEAAARTVDRVLFADTDLLTTCTWSEMIAGEVPAWLAGAAASQRYDLTLLLGDDVAWVDDGTRVLEDRRSEHTSRLRALLDAAGRPYVELHGSFESRFEHATRLAAGLLTRPISERQAG